MTKPTPAAIEQYILAAPEAGQAHVRALYQLLKQAAPHATETIKWGNPFFVEPRFVFAFSAFKNHCSFAPSTNAMAAFRSELDPKRSTKVFVKIPYNEPIPEDLIRRMAAFCVQELKERTTDSFW